MFDSGWYDEKLYISFSYSNGGLHYLLANMDVFSLKISLSFLHVGIKSFVILSKHPLVDNTFIGCNLVNFENT